MPERNIFNSKVVLEDEFSTKYGHLPMILGRSCMLTVSQDINIGKDEVAHHIKTGHHQLKTGREGRSDLRTQ